MTTTTTKTTGPEAAGDTTGPVSPANAALRLVTLPTMPMLGAAWLGAIIAGGTVAILMLVLSRGTDWVLGALIGAGVVAGTATLSLLALRPWQPKPLMKWPVLWVAASFLRLAVTVVATFLLYSATRFGTAGLVLAVVTAYVAVMAGETRMYANSMRRYAPNGVGAVGPEGASTKDEE
ncbi:MAG: hypothetical protein AAF432_04335 [Planctomycetota bacterium]